MFDTIIFNTICLSLFSAGSTFLSPETYDDCLQSDLVVSVSTTDRVLSSLKYMTTAYSLFSWSASQQKIVFGLY